MLKNCNVIFLAVAALLGSYARAAEGHRLAELYVEYQDGSSEIVHWKTTPQSEVTVSTALQASPLGEQRTLVMMIAYAPSVPDPTLVEQGRQAFFGTQSGSVAFYYRDVSNGKAWFTGDVLALSIDSTPVCELADKTAKADALAAKQVNLDNYTRRAYIFTYIDCFWSGMSTLGATAQTPNGTWYSAMWLKGGAGAAVHEMGHSLGMTHAASGTWDRGDPSDFMGGGPGLNAPHREQLLWVPSSEIRMVTASGVYDTFPLELPGNTRILKIRKSSTEHYYLSYRQPVGVSSGLNSLLTQGVSVHVWDGGGESLTNFVDTTPGSSLYNTDGALADGRSFYDSTNRILITQVSHTPVSATVQIQFDAAPPPEPPPPEPPPPAPCTPRGKSGKCR